MIASDSTRADRRRRQAVNSVLIALLIAFFGAMLGVIFGVVLGEVRGPEAWVIGLLAIVSSGLLLILAARPATATGVITGVLTVYFVLHINIGAVLAYAATPKVILIVPYITWFFPLVLFHHFTNFGFYKRAIGILVAVSPLPMAIYVFATLDDTADIGDVDALVTFLVSFFAFVLFVGFYTRHRDEEVLRAAMAEEAERGAEALRVSEERFRLLGLAANDLIWDADLAAGTVWWDESLQHDFGYHPDSFGTFGSAWDRWVHPDDHDRVVGSVKSALEGQDSNWTAEYRLMRADGRTIIVVDRGIILRNRAGEAVRMIGSTADVTALRALEKKLRQAQKMEAVGQLTGGVAHDFNNLLTIVMGSAEALADLHPDDPKTQKLAETTMQAAERGATLTSHLLSFARLQVLSPKHLDPGKLLAGIDELVRRAVPTNIQIEIASAPDVWPVELDPAQLENVILNLVINARDAMPDGGRVSITAANLTLMRGDPPPDETMHLGRYVVIDVTDTGSGMPAHVVELAFEPFFTTKESGKGSGLGLSMVWGFVQQSNGHAQIRSEPGVGTSVSLYFPAAQDLQAPAQAPRSALGLVGGKERILVVEDNEMVRRHAITQLGGLGYSTREAASAEEVLEIMESDWIFDLLFTDVVMPGGMSGLQLADVVRRRRPDLKVLYTSGYSEEAITSQGGLDPGVNLLVKPYRRADLAAMIRRVLDE